MSSDKTWRFYDGTGMPEWMPGWLGLPGTVAPDTETLGSAPELEGVGLPANAARFCESDRDQLAAFQHFLSIAPPPPTVAGQVMAERADGKVRREKR